MNASITRTRLVHPLLVAALAGSLLGSLVQPTSASPASRSGAGSATPAATQAAAQVQAPVPQIRWKQCKGFPRLRCAPVRVPLDYDRPLGDKISLRLVKRPANRPREAVGPLFINPGGPSGSSADFVLFGSELLGRAARRRFDIIGIDPRGTRGFGFACATKNCGSAPVRCQRRAGDVSRPALPPSFPITAAERRRTFAFDRWFRDICERRGNRILDHMSTADTARDMDLVRQAVGATQLSYYGISYGTFLGATYAAMFPERVRAMIVDGVLDPVAWTRGRGDSGRKLLVSSRLRSGNGAWEALTSAFAECDRVGRQRCAAAGDANSKWREITARLERGPVEVEGVPVTYQDVVGLALFTLYDAGTIPLLMFLIDDLHGLMFGARSSRSVRATGQADVADSVARIERAVRRNKGPDRPSYAAAQGFGPVSPSFHGVICADSVNPRTKAGVLTSDKRAALRSPWFGRPWAWASSACVDWPGSSTDAYRGSFHVETANPVLIVGNAHDPATSIAGARRLNQLLPGSRMLMLDAWGHGALGVSRCVTRRYSSYLRNGALPGPGTVCRPNRALFPRMRR